MASFKLAEWHVFPALNQLQRGSELIKLEPRAMDLLVYLAKADGRVVSADELLRDVWQNRVFDDGILYRKINQLRGALGDDSRHPRFIETIPKRGYRLIASVEWLRGEGSTGPRHGETAGNPDTTSPSEPQALLAARRALPPMASTGAAFGALAVAIAGGLIWSSYREGPAPPGPEARSLAVLPCENVSPDAEKAFFASGVHEALIDQLARIGFDVIARTTMLTYRDLPPPIPEVARTLSVDAVLECSVRYADDRVRIAVALVDAASSKTLWRDVYDREFANFFAIESSIALNVAQALETKLSPNQLATLEDVPSRSARAIELYFSGRRYEELGVLHWGTAAEQYEKAVEEDPQFARAYAQLAFVRLLMSWSVSPLPETLEQARLAAETAVTLAPNLVHSRISMLGARFVLGETAAGVVEELNALERAARDVFEFYVIRGRVNEALGRFEHALADIGRAVELGPPRNVPMLIAQAVAHQRLRRYDEAERLLARVADIAPDDWGVRCHRAVLPLFRYGDTAALRKMEHDILQDRAPLCGPMWLAAWLDGDHQMALSLIAKSVLAPDDPRRQQAEGMVLETAGQTERARPLLETALARFSAMLPTVSTDQRPGLQLAIAATHSYLGRSDEATRAARQALSATTDAPRTSELHLEAALIYGRAGAGNLAVAELERYLAQPGDWTIEGILRRPELAPIRHDPDFQTLVRKYARK